MVSTNLSGTRFWCPNQDLYVHIWILTLNIYIHSKGSMFKFWPNSSTRPGLQPFWLRAIIRSALLQRIIECMFYAPSGQHLWVLLGPPYFGWQLTQCVVVGKQYSWGNWGSSTIVADCSLLHWWTRSSLVQSQDVYPRFFPTSSGGAAEIPPTSRGGGAKLPCPEKRKYSKKFWKYFKKF